MAHPVPNTLLALPLLLVGALAHAAGTASPPPPTPPKVDFASLPDTASIRPMNADDKPHQVHARLLTDVDSAKPGQTIRVGLHMTQDKDWHTYWKSPGDIGLPTDITWQLPDGATAGPYAYPVPQRFEYEGIVSFGYDHEVLLYSEVTLPTEGLGDSVTLGASAAWLVCESSCIPGSVELSFDLPIDPAAGAPGKFAPLFDHYAAQHPVDATTVADVAFEAALSHSAVQPEKPFKAAFLITPTTGEPLAGLAKAEHTWPTFTPIAGFDWMVSKVDVKPVDGGAVLVVLEGETFAPDPLPADATVGGLIQVKVGEQWVRSEFTIPMPWVAADAAVTESASPLWKLASGEVTVGADPVASSAAAAPVADETSLPVMLGLAFLGGLLLNIMPCVLPVLTLKLYGLVEQSDITAGARRNAGLAYTAGIVASFLALAAAVVVVQQTVGAVGWGFQFQYPPYVAALATIVFAFGLSLFGVFEIPAFGEETAAEASSKEGAAGYFLTGVFATLVATPCSAPFLGTALGFAFAQPAVVILLFFAIIGLGLAAPFLLIAFVPALFKLLPRPGAWMETFKQLMGFTLIATTVWLTDVLAAQVGSDRATGFLAFLVFVGLGAWIFGHWGGLAESRARQGVSLLVGTAVAALGGFIFLDLQFAEAAAADCGDTEVDVAQLEFHEEIPWQPFSDNAVTALAGKPIFVDFTADWCLTCKVNEKTVLETEKIRTAMSDLGVVPLKADWTRRDPAISSWLQKYGRAGVPFYLVLPADPNAEAIPLGEVITPDGVIEAMKKAAGES